MKVIPASYTGVKFTLGRFAGLIRPGLHFYVPGMSQVKLMSNKLFQMSHTIEAKTRDHAIVSLPVVVKYHVKAEDSANALLSLAEPQQQIANSITNVIRAQVPKFELDELFASTTEIADSVNRDLRSKYIEYGYTIEEVFFTDVIPDKTVTESMNRINAAKRIKMAAESEAQAILIRAEAEAEAERLRKRLNGKGIREMRDEMFSGSAEAIETMCGTLDITPREAMKFVLSSMSLDMKARLAESDNMKILFVPDKDSRLESLEAAGSEK